MPGETAIPVSGKVLTEDDLANLLDASLDLWLTGGRFTEVFEKNLSLATSTKFARMTVSGSAANLLALTCLTSPRQRGRLKPGDEVLTVAAGVLAPLTAATVLWTARRTHHGRWR